MGVQCARITEMSKKPCQMRPLFGPPSYVAVAIPLYLSTVELLPEPDQLIPLSRDRGGMGSVPAKHGPAQGGTQVTFHGSGDSNTIGPLQDALGGPRVLPLEIWMEREIAIPGTRSPGCMIRL